MGEFGIILLLLYSYASIGIYQMEQEFKNREGRRETFLNKVWKVSKNQNLYLKIRDQLIVLYCNPRTDRWKFSVNGKFCDETYATKEQAKNAVFEVIDSNSSVPS